MCEREEGVEGEKEKETDSCLVWSPTQGSIPGPQNHNLSLNQESDVQPAEPDGCSTVFVCFHKICRRNVNGNQLRCSLSSVTFSLKSTDKGVTMGIWEIEVGKTVRTQLFSWIQSLKYLNMLCIISSTFSVLFPRVFNFMDPTQHLFCGLPGRTVNRNPIEISLACYLIKEYLPPGNRKACILHTSNRPNRSWFSLCEICQFSCSFLVFLRVQEHWLLKEFYP